MNWTVVIVLLVIALTVLGIGIALSYWEPSGNKVTTVEPELFPLRSAVRSLPPQSVSGLIPYGQATGDYSDPEATYEDMELAPPDWSHHGHV